MKRTTWVLLAILAVLAAAAIILLQQPGEQSSSGTLGAPLLTFDSTAVDRIEVLSPATQVVVTKEGGRWMMTSPVHAPADEGTVTGALARGRSLQLKALVSSNPAKQGLFALDSSATLVRFSHQGQELGAFRIGKPGPSYMDTYVRKEGSPEVYLAEGMLTSAFGQPVKDWRDRTIFQAPASSLRQITFHYGDTTFTAAFHDSLWTIDDTPVRSSAWQSCLSALANLRADDFVDSTLTPAPVPGAVIDLDGTQLRFAHDPHAPRWLVQTSRAQQWFTLQEWQASQVLKRKKELLGGS